MGITSSSVWVSFFGLRYLSSLQFPLATVVCLSSVYPCLETEKGSVFLRFPNTAREKKKKKRLSSERKTFGKVRKMWLMNTIKSIAE